MIADCTALILAGGDSRRMGRDKTALRLGGRSLLQRALDSMNTLFPVTLVSIRKTRADIGNVAQVHDEVPDAGPLAGLCAGLRKARTPWVFAVAVDMPFLLPEVIEHLALMRAGRQAVVPLVDGHLQPLMAFYATTALPTLRAALDREEKCGLCAALAGLDICQVDENSLRGLDQNLRSFIDL
ncbi:MAG: molybdenum cofactor guanylyltransferase, partial [Azoarcus sp.]|nr:molybdenum cofactor guanylyltransferase [Azoarcus sp.]